MGDSVVGRGAPSTGGGPSVRPSLRLSLAVAFSSCVLFGLVSLHLGQDLNWDLKNYHYYNGYALLNGRLDIDIMAAQQQTYHSPLVDVVPYLLLRHSGPRSFGFLMGAFHGLAPWLVFLLAFAVLRDLGSRGQLFLALACGALAGCGAGALSELGTTFHDLTASVFVLGGVLLAVRALIEWAPGWDSSIMPALVVSGLLAGIAVGLKLTAASYVVGFACALLTWRGGLRRLLTVVGSWAVGVVLGVGLTAGGWMLALWNRFDNPLFPYFNSVFHSAYWSSRPSALVGLPPWWVQHSGHFLFAPFYFRLGEGFALQQPFQDLRLAVVYVLLVTSILLAGASVAKAAVTGEGSWRAALSTSLPGRRVGGPFLLVFFVVSFVAWLENVPMYRYLIPLEQLAPVVVCMLVGRLVRRRAVVVGVSLILLTVMALTVRPPRLGRKSWSNEAFGVTVPYADDLDGAVVVMTSEGNISYVLPYFPETCSFVRVESNFFRPYCESRLAEDISAFLEDFTGQFFLLTAHRDLDRSQDSLDYYGLELDPASCRMVTSDAGPDPILCRVSRTDAGRDMGSLPGPVRVDLASPKPFAGGAEVFSRRPFLISRSISGDWLADLRLELDPVLADWRLAVEYELVTVETGEGGDILTFRRRRDPRQGVTLDLLSELEQARLSIREQMGKAVHVRVADFVSVRRNVELIGPGRRRRLQEAVRDRGVLEGKVSPEVQRQLSALLNCTRDFIVQRPPGGSLGTVMGFPVRVVSGSRLKGSFGMLPEAWRSGASDGACYAISVVDSTGRETRALEQCLDPATDPRDRYWQWFKIDLEPWAGQEVVLEFSVTAGPRGDATDDFGGWGQPQIFGVCP